MRNPQLLKRELGLNLTLRKKSLYNLIHNQNKHKKADG